MKKTRWMEIKERIAAGRMTEEEIQEKAWTAWTAWFKGDVYKMNGNFYDIITDEYICKA